MSKKTKVKKTVQEAYEEIMNTPLSKFLKETESLGYSFFCNDIIKKVVTARVHKKIKA